MKPKLEGKFARLPYGQKVRIERVDGARATVRRIGGARHRSIAVCWIDQINAQQVKVIRLASP